MSTISVNLPSVEVFDSGENEMQQTRTYDIAGHERGAVTGTGPFARTTILCMYALGVHGD